jgi:hypothetical protein
MNVDNVNVKFSLASLKEKETESFDFEIPPQFLDIIEEELKFEDPVFVRGIIQVTASDLNLVITAQTKGYMPCLICNEMSCFILKIENFTFSEKLSNLGSNLSKGYFDLLPVLREALLVHLPTVLECSNFDCPKRKELANYLPKKRNLSHLSEERKVYYPFQELTLEKDPR